WARTSTTPQTPLRARTSTLTMPKPRLSLRNCVARWLPAGLTVPLGSAFPDQTELVAVGIGRTAWVAIPAELQSELAESVKRGGAGGGGRGLGNVSSSRGWGTFFLDPSGPPGWRGGRAMSGAGACTDRGQGSAWPARPSDC